MNRENGVPMIAWLVAGAAVGAAVALLLAPAAGEKTRRMLTEQAERGRKGVLESGQELFARGRELYERGREIAEDVAEVFERSRRLAEKTFSDKV